MEYLLMFLLAITGCFLILLVLIQRGRGGGLAGAFGGMGGQSAFGTKAGDMFTRITIGAAAVWIILCAVSVKLLGTTETKFSQTLGTQSSGPAATGAPTDDPAKPGATGKSGATGASASPAAGADQKPETSVTPTNGNSGAPKAATSVPAPAAGTTAPAEAPPRRGSAR